MTVGSLQVRASRYYQRWLGGELSVILRVEGAVTLAQLLARLSADLPNFPELPVHDGSRLAAEVLVFDGQRFLRPHDLVSPGASIELLPPTAGG